MADGMRCPCSNCRTGKCSCPECSEGPGINFKRHHVDDDLRRAIIADIARERARIYDSRAPSVERQRVRRWGDIEITGRTEDRETIRNENEE